MLPFNNKKSSNLSIKQSCSLSAEKKHASSTKINYATWVSEKNHVISLHKKSRNLSTHKITQPLNKKYHAISQQKNYATSPQKKLSKKNDATSPQTKNHATSPHTKIMQPLIKTKKWCNLSTKRIMHLSTIKKKTRNLSTKKIARIAKRCPENITVVVKCQKLLFPKVLIFFYSRDSSDSMDSSENNHATSPHTKKNKQPPKFLFLFKKKLFQYF